MALRRLPRAGLSLCAILVAAATVEGCILGYWTYSTAGGGTEAALGEQHDVNFPAHDAFVLAQDVLRAEGILYTVRPDDSLVTNWRPADNGPGILKSIIGVYPRYRYEIRAVPIASHKSRIVVNVRADDIPPAEASAYKVSGRLHLFSKIDELARKNPPPSATPREGGVNFALLPGEDLKGLAKRATGDENNWRAIAKDNGLKSPSDLAGVNSVWVRNALLNRATAPPQAGSGN